MQLGAPPPGNTGCGLLMVPGGMRVCEPGGKGPPIPSPVSRSHARGALAKAADGAGMAGIQSRWSSSQKLKDVPGGTHGWRVRSEGRTQGLSGGGRRRGCWGGPFSIVPTLSPGQEHAGGCWGPAGRAPGDAPPQCPRAAGQQRAASPAQRHLVALQSGGWRPRARGGTGWREGSARLLSKRELARPSVRLRLPR